MRLFWGSDKATMDIAFEPNACHRSPEQGLRIIAGQDSGPRRGEQAASR
jgi:hypothetical protein